MFARVLTRDTREDALRRFTAYVDEHEAERACAMLDVAPLVIDEPAPCCGEAAAHLRERGAFAQVAERHFVVVARAELLRELRNGAAADVRDVFDALLRAWENTNLRPRALRLKAHTIHIGGVAAVMGILNVTPDSFYDRGAYKGLDAARARAFEMLEQGAAILDVGGRSSASGSRAVSEEEECARIVPLITALVKENIGVPLSVDTSVARVARAALEAGADLINDCSGLADAHMAETVAAYDAGLVLMHIKGRLHHLAGQEYVYADALAEILVFLHERMEQAVRAGVARESLIVDPGLEFGKETCTDLEILKRFGDLRALGAPMLLAASRKNFMREVLGAPNAQSPVPSLAAAAVGIAAGAALIRAHDVKETVQLAAMMGAIL